MFATYIVLIYTACSLPLSVRSVQIRLTNSQADTARASKYNNGVADAYSYNYGISDESTGDSKAKWEKRENNIVRGAYSIVEPDGTTRLVEYTADANGFHPVITKLDPSKPVNTVPPNYDISAVNVYSPSALDYRNRNNQRPANNLNYNIVSNNRRNAYESNSYPIPISSSGYSNGYNSKLRPTGYGALTGGYDDPNVSGTPYHLSLRQGRQPAPLLHSAYHGYDNLYH